MAASMLRHLPTTSRYMTSHFSMFSRKTPKFIALSPVTKTSDLTLVNTIPFAVGFAKKAGKNPVPVVVEEEVVEVNKNPEDLVKYCIGSNYFKEGSDVELKADEEYPNWLWDIHIGPPKKLDELDEDSLQYWRKLRKINMKRNNRLAKLKKF